MVAVDGRPGRWDARDQLVNVLSDADAVSDDGVARTALALVVQSPKVVTGLDWHVRQVAWRSPYCSPILTRLAARLESGPAGPIAVAVASMHGDGRVRERAVTAMLDRPGAELMPFLALRTADWVVPVRDRPRAAPALLLASDPGGHLRASLPCTVPIPDHGRWPAAWLVESGGAPVLADNAAEESGAPHWAVERDGGGVVVGWMLIEVWCGRWSSKWRSYSLRTRRA